ncbi:MAG: RteC domain-containing protein [Bacteroidetes bacterium]|nr:RteC domain-containing protein [Bacteroidota bacterium]
MIYWSYKTDAEVSLSTNIKRLTQLLSFRNLEFITTDVFNSDDANNLEKQYNISSIQMVGNAKYVKDYLSSSTDELICLLETLVQGEESIETKIYELLKARLIIKLYPDQQFIPIRFVQCIFSKEAREELQNHQEVRHGYMEMLDSHLAIELDMLYLLPIEQKINDEKPNKIKEKQLLEVWVALKESGFINHLETNNEITAQRKAFFELFNLTDRDYDDRNKQLKIKKKDRASFLEKLKELIKDYQ